MLGEILLTDSAFDAFCIDHFLHVHRVFSAGMDRTQKVNLLLAQTEPSVLLARLSENYAEAVSRHVHLVTKARPSRLQLGDYEIGQVIGQGGCATVYEARHVVTGSVWAVKQMHKHILLRSQDSKRRFEQEARLASSIDNPHIVRVVSTGVDAAGVPWLAMELLKGETLGSYLARKPDGLTLDEARSILKQLCFGLAAAHRRNIVHRDLKPDNLFLAATGLAEGPERIVKILDFGLSKVIEESRVDQSSQMLGTIAWMSPEHYDHKLAMGPATDVWAIGLIAFKMLTGHHYFLSADQNISSSPLHMFREVVTDPLLPASARAAHYACADRIPAGFDTWFAECTSREIRARIQNAEQAYVLFGDHVLSTQIHQDAIPSSNLSVKELSVKRATRQPPVPPLPPTPGKVVAHTGVPSGMSRSPQQSVEQRQKAKNDWDGVIAAKLSQIPTSTKTARVKLFLEIAEIYDTKLEKPQEAISVYLEAIAIQPDDSIALHKILELYTKTEQWQRATEILTRLAALETNPERRGKFYYTLGVIFRDALKSSNEAIEQFNLALDSYRDQPELALPEQFQKFLKPFEALEKICTTRQDWRSLEQNYRSMLQRLPKTGQEEYTLSLWNKLADICQLNLNNINAAIQAKEMVVQLDISNLKQHEALADLYISSGPEHFDKAITEYMMIISRNPFEVSSYKKIRSIYIELGNYDKAWCVCSVLVCLKQADADELQFFEQYKPQRFIPLKSVITDEIWAKYVYHPDEDRFLDNISSSIYEALGTYFGAEYKSYGFKRAEKQNLANDGTLIGNILSRVMRTLNMATNIEIFFRPELKSELLIANCLERKVFTPSIVVGHPMLTENRNQQEIAFLVATFLAKMRPEHYLRQLINNRFDLSCWVMAAIRTVIPQFSLSAEQIEQVEQFTRVLQQHLSNASRELLSEIVPTQIAQKNPIDVSKWIRAVDLTAHRTGLIIVNDLSVAARLIAEEPTQVGGMRPQEKLRELILFAISEPYFELRQMLDIDIS